MASSHNATINPFCKRVPTKYDPIVELADEIKGNLGQRLNPIFSVFVLVVMILKSGG